ncbi:hypothetical protein BC829DRAFT_491575 [Chytridium lagenaria]|nr:hypothetical protein BC829DRAFT_491575 [Chytridium lagenaria]
MTHTGTNKHILFLLLIIIIITLINPILCQRDPTTNTTYYLVNCAVDTNAFTACRARHPTSGSASCSLLHMTTRGAVGVMNIQVNSRGWSMGVSGSSVPRNSWGTDLNPMIPQLDTSGSMSSFIVWEGQTWRFKGVDGYNGQSVTARVDGGGHVKGKRMGSLRVTCSNDPYCKKSEGVADVFGSDLTYVYASQKAYFAEDGSMSKVRPWYYCWRVYEAKVN